MKLKTYFTTYEEDLVKKVAEIDPNLFVDIKLTSTPYSSEGDSLVEYGFLLIYKEN
jgi:hypothetical protein